MDEKAKTVRKKLTLILRLKDPAGLAPDFGLGRGVVGVREMVVDIDLTMPLEQRRNELGTLTAQFIDDLLVVDVYARQLEPLDEEE